VRGHVDPVPERDRAYIQRCEEVLEVRQRQSEGQISLKVFADDAALHESMTIQFMVGASSRSYAVGLMNPLQIDAFVTISLAMFHEHLCRDVLA
jgi:hypothetical protein